MKNLIHQFMHLCPGNSFAETSGQNNPQGIPHLFLCFQTVNIQCYDGAPAPVQTQQTFLAQHTVRLIYGMHINPYEKGNIFNKDPLRVRKLLLHKSEINKLAGQIKMKGYTLMPLKVYFKGSLVKVEIGLARGKKLYDKRQDIAKKDAKREAERDFKIRNLG